MRVRVIFPVIFGILILGTMGLSQESSNVFAQSDSVKIPDWIKNIAAFWSQGAISDGEFTDSLEFLIKEKIIQSPEIRVLDKLPSDIVQEKTTRQHYFILKSQLALLQSEPSSALNFLGRINHADLFVRKKRRS